jgi:hypothetical protein
MGVLGWTPETVMRGASLCELHDAWLGYAERHGLAAAAPAVTAKFLGEMLRRFPDERKR